MKKRRHQESPQTWRKLHIGLDPETGDMAALELAIEHVGDETALPDLPTDVDADVSLFLADGAYDD